MLNNEWMCAIWIGVRKWEQWREKYEQSATLRPQSLSEVNTVPLLYMGRQYAVRIYSKIWTWTGYITAPFHAVSACCLAIYTSLAVPILHLKNLDTTSKSGQNITNSVLPHISWYSWRRTSHLIIRLCKMFKIGLEIGTRWFSQSRGAEIVRGAFCEEIEKATRGLLARVVSVTVPFTMPYLDTRQDTNLDTQHAHPSSKDRKFFIMCRESMWRGAGFSQASEEASRTTTRPFFTLRCSLRWEVQRLLRCPLRSSLRRPPHCPLHPLSLFLWMLKFLFKWTKEF